MEDVSYFIIDTISLCLNTILTFLVFFITLGFGLSIIIGSALLVSIIIVSVLNTKIDALAKSSQDKKLRINTYLSPHCDYLFNADSVMQNKTNNTLSKKLEKFFKTTVFYSALEQVVAAIPILITVPALIGFLVLNYFNVNTSELGVMIAVLPRTSQLLGNVHELSLSNSRVLFKRYKYTHLLKFKLDTINLESHLTEGDIINPQ